MSRQWKPGDVAMVTYRPGVECISVLTDRQELAPLWIAGSERAIWGRDGEVEVRPLVVIDPEDREQVERLVGSFRGKYGWASSIGRESSDAMQAALRSLIAPPKPDEPTGLGAVVEDADLLRWVRVEPHVSGNSTPVCAWRAREVGKAPREYSWANIAAVRVLSPGVDA